MQGDEFGNLAEFGGPTLDVKYSFSNFSFKVKHLSLILILLQVVFLFSFSELYCKRTLKKIDCRRCLHFLQVAILTFILTKLFVCRTCLNSLLSIMIYLSKVLKNQQKLQNQMFPEKIPFFPAISSCFLNFAFRYLISTFSRSNNVERRYTAYMQRRILHINQQLFQ